MTDTEAAAAADQLDPTDPDRAAADGADGAVDQEAHRGDPADDDDQEVLIDAVVAADEPDPQPDATP